MSTPKRPVLRYHGGKWKLAPWIISHFPPHRIYTEAYGGAASVLMRKPQCYAEVYNDLEGHVVNVFRVLQDPMQARELYRLLALTPFARKEFELAYMPAPDPIEAARRSIIRAFMGFGSAAHNSKHATGFRANSNRSGTTPAHDWVNYPNQIEAFTDRLRGVVIESRPAVQVILQHDQPDCLHYVDPPYVHTTRSQRQDHNYQYEMTDQEHRDLAGVLHSVKGMVVLSGYASDLYSELYGDWYNVTRLAHADGARARTECLWISPNVKAVGSQLRLVGMADAPLFNTPLEASA
jgi:DNA adenine methylase